jgi:hypothetical protein
VRAERFVAMGRTVWDRAGDGLLAAALFLASLLLYVQTLAPSVATLFDDSLEFPLVSYLLGIAHPTGYPLYILLGKLFTLGPWSNVPWAVNLLSAVSSALAVSLVYLVARELAARRFPAVVGALALAVSPVFWSQSVIAEVYGLNSLFVAALLWLALRWARRPLLPVTPFSLLLVAPKHRGPLFLPAEGIWLRLPPAVRRLAARLRSGYRHLFAAIPPQARLRLHPRIYALAALYGLSLTHHRTILLLAPGLLVFLFLVERRLFSRAALLGPEHRERPRWLQIAGLPVVLLVACLIVPLLLYLYLPLRGHVGSLDGAYSNTWSGFWQWVTASGYGTFLGPNPLARHLGPAFYLDLFWQQFGPVGLALALVGLLGLLRRPKLLALTGLAFATYVAFALAYHVPDVEVFFIPAFLLAAVWIGLGLDVAAGLLRLRGRSLALRRVLAVSSALLFLGALAQPLAIATRSAPDLDLSRRWIVHDYAEYVLDQDLPYGNSTVVGLGGEVTLLRTFQATTGRRTDVETIRADDEVARRAAIDAALAAGRAVFITRPLPGLCDEYALASVIGLIDVGGEPETLIRVGAPDHQSPAVPRPVDQGAFPGFRLLGYGLLEHRGHWQSWLRLRLWWQPTQALGQLKFSARLLAANGQLIAATDAEPVSWAYPTTAWRPGEVIPDAYEIPLPAGTPPGEYSLLVIAYEPASGVEVGRAQLGPAHLEGNPARPPRRALEASVGRLLYGRFGEVELLGFTPPDPARVYQPGDLLSAVFLWQAREQPAGDLRLDLWLQRGGNVPLLDRPVGGPFPTDRWRAGQTVRQGLQLQIPNDILPGTYRLKMRITRDGRPLPWGRSWIPLGSDLDLGSVQVGP